MKAARPSWKARRVSSSPEVITARGERPLATVWRSHSRPSRARELGRPDDVDGEDVEVLGAAFERSDEHLARDVGLVGQRLRAQDEVGILRPKAIEKGMERRRIAP